MVGRDSCEFFNESIMQSICAHGHAAARERTCDRIPVIREVEELRTFRYIATLEGTSTLGQEHEFSCRRALVPEHSGD